MFSSLSDAIINTVSQPLLVLDVRMRVRWANHAFHKAFGFSRSVEGEHVFLLRPGESDKYDVRELLEQLLTQSGALENFELDHSFPSLGGRRVLLVNAREIHHRNGSERLWLVTIDDITARRVAEEAHLESEQRLEQSRRMEAVGKLAGGIAHDFNNLLTAIRGYSELVRLSLPAESEAAHDVGEIIAASDSAAAFTRQLLTLGRRQVRQLELMELGVVVREMEGMLASIVGKNLQLAVTVDEQLPAVRADRGQIEQVIVNLVVNARDAMPDSGTLSIHVSHDSIDAALAAANPDAPVGPCVKLTVTDTGRAISSEVQPHIFEPFFSTKAEERGTGLGLATVYGIVNQSGGCITVRSEPGAGSQFSVYLPEADSVLGTTSKPFSTSMSTAVDNAPHRALHC